MDINTIITGIVSNPSIQSAALAILVSVVVQAWKGFAVSYDKAATGTTQQTPLQLVTIICTFIASAATLAAQNKLEGVDANSVINFVTTALPAYLASFGWTAAATSVKNTVTQTPPKA